MMQIVQNNIAAMSMYQRYDTAKTRGDGFTEMLHSSSDNPSRPEEDLSAQAAAKKKALEKFHPSRIAQRHVEIYQEVLGKF